MDWALRAVESGKHLTLTTERRDGKVKVIVEARAEDLAVAKTTDWVL